MCIAAGTLMLVHIRHNGQDGGRNIAAVLGVLVEAKCLPRSRKSEEENEGGDGYTHVEMQASQSRQCFAGDQNRSPCWSFAHEHLSKHAGTGELEAWSTEGADTKGFGASLHIDETRLLESADDTGCDTHA